MAVTSADYMLMVESSSPALKLQQCHSIRIKSRYYSLHMHYELKKKLQDFFWGVTADLLLWLQNVLILSS